MRVLGGDVSGLDGRCHYVVKIRQLANCEIEPQILDMNEVAAVLKRMGKRAVPLFG